MCATRIMSTIIAEKYNKWSDKVRSGSCDITMITRVDDIWYLIRNRHAEKLLFLKIVICEEDGTTHNEFTLDSPPEEDCVLLIKDEQRMIMRRGEDQFDAFGMKNYGSIAKKRNSDQSAEDHRSVCQAGRGLPRSGGIGAEFCGRG